MNIELPDPNKSLLGIESQKPVHSRFIPHVKINFEFQHRMFTEETLDKS